MKYYTRDSSLTLKTMDMFSRLDGMCAQENRFNNGSFNSRYSFSFGLFFFRRRIKTAKKKIEIVT